VDCNLPFAVLIVPRTASDLLTASSWRSVAHNVASGLRHGLLFFLIIFLVESFYGERNSRYKSRNFLHDACYWIYGRSDLPRILFTASLFAWLSKHLAFLQITSFQAVPALIRIPIAFILVDFTTYWIHRWQHTNKVLWAFHSVHHSQEEMTFATSSRFHPIDNFVLTTLAFFPMLLLGQPIQMVLPVYLAMEFLVAIQHSQIPWSYGPLYPVVVSPNFHSIHHSIDPEHYNQHFGRMFSLWDYLFGTAAPDQTRPATYGLQDWKMPTLLSQLYFPFVHLFRDLVKSNQQNNSVANLQASTLATPIELDNAREEALCRRE
jgi:sterol desaturase/sphingolipid hydroxylase (fatty acid hydroxylase superfamily)